MSISRYPDKTNEAIIYSGSGTNFLPASTISSGLFQITPNIDIAIGNTRYSKNTTTPIYLSTTATMTFLPLGESTFYPSTKRFAFTGRVLPSQNDRCIWYLNNLFFAADNTAQFASSTDAVTWTTRAIYMSSGVRNMVYGNGIYVAAGGTANTATKVNTSTDGITWVTRTTYLSSRYVLSLGFGNGIFFAGGSNGGLLNTSTDGITWVTRATPSTGSILGVVYGNSTYVMAYSEGLATSTDGITWTTRLLTGNQTVLLSFTNNLFWISNTNAELYNSTNGITWTLRIGNTVSSMNNLTYNGSQYLAFNEGRFYQSTDGITWVEDFWPTGVNGLYSIIGNNNIVWATNLTSGVEIYTSDKSNNDAVAILSNLGIVTSTTNAV